MLRFQSNAIKEKPLFLPPSPPSFLIYLPRGRNAALGNRTAAPGGTSAFIFQLPRGCPCGGGGEGHGSIEPPAPREPAIISNIHGISRSHRNQIKARFGGGGGGGGALGPPLGCVGNAERGLPGVRERKTTTNKPELNQAQRRQSGRCARKGRRDTARLRIQPPGSARGCFPLNFPTDVSVGCAYLFVLGAPGRAGSGLAWRSAHPVRAEIRRV